MMVVDMDLGGRKERQTNRAIAVYTYGHLVRARNINSTRQGTQSARRADAFRPLDKRARQQFALGLLWLRQCAHSLDGVSTGRQSRDVLKPSKAPPIMLPPGQRSTPATKVHARSCPGAGEPRAWVG